MKTYISKYASPLLRGTDNPETPRPWDIQSILEQYSTTRRRLLDVGCGTCFKLIPLNTYFDDIVGLDISESMLRAAEKNIESHGIKNIHLLMADSYKMPLQDNQFDLMTGLLSRWNIQELQRVLSKDGLIIFNKK